MIEFHSTCEFELSDSAICKRWIAELLTREGKTLGDVNYIFCDDEYLHKLNVDFLDHDTLTDVISFDYTAENVVSGDIYISVQRVGENAEVYDVTFKEELNRVMAHGLLHYCGYKDKSEEDAKVMRKKENEALELINRLKSEE